MIILRCVYHYGENYRREWEVSAPNLSASIREAYRDEPAMSADMFDAIYSDLLNKGMTDRYSWQRVYVVEGVN